MLKSLPDLFFNVWNAFQLLTGAKLHISHFEKQNKIVT